MAVRPNIESVYDYFLFKVESDGIIQLASNTVDENGLSYPAGSQVLDGFFFELLKESKKGSTYRLSSKQSYIHKDTVLSIGVDLSNLDDGLHCLDQLGHNEVMLSLF